MSEVKAAAAEKEAARIKAAAEAEAARIAQEMRITEKAARIKAAAEAEAARIAEEMRITKEAAKVKAETKPVTTNNSFSFWTNVKLFSNDVMLVLPPLLLCGDWATAYTNFHHLTMRYHLMMRPEPSVNSWYSDNVGTLILISCLVIYVCWKVFLNKFFSFCNIVWLSCFKHVCHGEFMPDCKSPPPTFTPTHHNQLQQTQQYYAQPQQSQQYYAQLRQELFEGEYFISQGGFTPGVKVLQHPVSHQLSSPLSSTPYSYAPLGNNIQPPFTPTHHNQLQQIQIQQYYAQLQQSQQNHAQLRQELLEGKYFISQGGFTPGVQVLQHPVSHHLSSPLPSTPYSYCNNIQPHNLHIGQFSTPPRSERRLHLNEQKLDYSAKKML
jgi:hypothetical protein